MNFINILQFPFLMYSNLPFMVDLAGLSKYFQILAVYNTPKGVVFHNMIFHFKQQSLLSQGIRNSQKLLSTPVQLNHHPYIRGQ